MSKNWEQILTEFELFRQFALANANDLAAICKALASLDLKFGTDISYAYSIDGMISNIAHDLGNLTLAQIAFRRLKNRGFAQGPKFHFDSGNMLYLIGSLKRKTNDVRGILEIKEFSQAQVAFSKVVPDDSEAFERAYTNLANFLDHTGRNYEAIYFYDKVLAKNPDFGMALGNKARTIVNYVWKTPQQSMALLDTCVKLFEKALADPNLKNVGGPNIEKDFEGSKKRVESILQEFQYRPNEPKLTSRSKYLNFCLKKNLFLNFDFGYVYDEESFQDTFFPKFSGRIDEQASKFTKGMSEKIHFCFHVFNQILEDFSTSRYLLFLSEQKSYRHLDRQTKYTYTLDYTKNSLKYGLLKRSFAGLYSILEKLALMLVNYTGVKSTFNTDLDVHLGALIESSFAKMAISKNNYNLLAMHQLAKDFEPSQLYHKYRRIRNLITHSFLSVDTGLLMSDAEFIIDQGDLTSLTEDLFHVVKSAIMYSVLFIEEDTRNLDEKAVSLYATSQKDIFRRFN